MLEIQRIYSSALRSSYQLAAKSKTEKEIRHELKIKFKLPSWLLQCTIREGIEIFELRGHGVIFGGKNNLNESSAQNIRRTIGHGDTESYQAYQIIDKQFDGWGSNVVVEIRDDEKLAKEILALMQSRSSS